MTKLCPIPLNIEQYRSILCLNGKLPEPSFFTQSLPIIAADGAANTLVAMGITPQLIIGDLDSVTPEIRSRFPILLCPDQDFCDFEKSLTYLAKQQLLPCIITGINGGTLDHVLNNINILYHHPNNVIYAPPIIGYFITQNRKFFLPLHTKLSIIGLPRAIITSNGLEWELEDYDAIFPGKNSCFNRTIQEEITINITNGCALILIHQHDNG